MPEPLKARATDPSANCNRLRAVFFCLEFLSAKKIPTEVGTGVQTPGLAEGINHHRQGMGSCENMHSWTDLLLLYH